MHTPDPSFDIKLMENGWQTSKLPLLIFSPYAFILPRRYIIFYELKQVSSYTSHYQTQEFFAMVNPFLLKMRVMEVFSEN